MTGAVLKCLVSKRFSIGLCQMCCDSPGQGFRTSITIFFHTVTCELRQNEVDSFIPVLLRGNLTVAKEGTKGPGRKFHTTWHSVDLLSSVETTSPSPIRQSSCCPRYAYHAVSIENATLRTDRNGRASSSVTMKCSRTNLVASHSVGA